MSKITRDDFEHILEVANDFEKLDAEMQKKVEIMAKLIAATQQAADEKKGEELDANSERSGGVNPRREEA